MKKSNSTSSLYIESAAAAPCKVQLAAAIATVFERMLQDSTEGPYSSVFNPGGVARDLNPSSDQIYRYMVFIGVKSARKPPSFSRVTDLPASCVF